VKIATLPGPTLDGRPVLVSRDLTRAAPIDDLAPSLLAALQDWGSLAPLLTKRAALLETDPAAAGTTTGFDPAAALAPLPRAPQWLDGSVFQNHLDLMARALHPDRPNEPSETPLIYQGASDDFQGPRADIAGFRIDEGIDFEGEFGVIVDDVPMRVSPEQALDHIKLVVLLNDVSLRAYAGREIAGGFGFLNAKPSTAFAPVAVTPDELGSAWADGRVNLPVQVQRSGQWFGHPNGREMTFHFGALVAHAARTRRLSAGTIVGSGTVSNDDRSAGSACIAERRAIEIIDTGSPSTAFLEDGETVEIDCFDGDGRSVFGTIHQKVIVGS
jgi:fumarylacetoacetate (FAA) hydrolase